MAEGHACLAPGGEHPDLLEKTDRDRPDLALRPASVLVGVGECELALLVQRLADDRKRRALGFSLSACGDQEGRPVERRGALRRQHCSDLGERVASRPRQALVGPALDPARAERQRLDLLEGEHQRRQVKARLENIAEAGLPLDRGALRLQRGDIAIERAQRDAEFLRQRRARDRQHGGGGDSA